MSTRYETGKVLDIVKMNEPMKGAAITEPINDRTMIYSLGKDTDIEAESFQQYHFLFIAAGKILCYALNEAGIQNSWTVEKGCVTLLPVDMPVGVRALEDSVYTRVAVVRREDILSSIETEKSYMLKDLVSYEDGKAVSLSVVFNEAMQIRLFAMDANTVIQGSALARGGITSLEGSFEILYNGQKSLVHEGEQFIVEKGSSVELHASQGRTRLNVVTNTL